MAKRVADPRSNQIEHYLDRSLRDVDSGSESRAEPSGPISPHSIGNWGNWECHGANDSSHRGGDRLATGGAAQLSSPSAARLVPGTAISFGAERGVELGVKRAMGSAEKSTEAALSGVVTALERSSASPTRRRGVHNIAQDLPEGSTFTANHRNGVVTKRVKEVIGRPGEQFRLSAADRERLGREIELATKRLRAELGSIVLPVRNDRGGQLRQPYVEGHVLEELHGIDALERADEAIGQALDRARTTLARRTHGATADGTWIRYADGWSVKIDHEASNFRFDGDGNLLAWFDPVVVRPPDGLRVD